MRVIAGRLELDGQILAMGQRALESAQRNGAGGAGGAVWVTTDELAGGGSIDASGGPGGSAGGALAAGGGGGRVAVDYVTLDAVDPFDRDAVFATGGAGGTATNGGGPGTVYFSNDKTLRVDNDGAVHVVETAPWVEIGARRATAVGANTITSSGAGWLVHSLVGAEVMVVASGQRFTVVGNGADTLELDPADGDVTSALAVGGDFVGWRERDVNLVLRGRANATFDDRVKSTSLTIQDARLNHPLAPAGGHEPGLWVELTADATVMAEGAIDVSGRGYRGACNGVGCGLGYTSGNVASGAGQHSGGSHGGTGAGATPGATYGDSTGAFELGAGGGYGTGGGEPGGNGGGRLSLIASTLTVLGTILADGAPSVPINQQNGGCGAGGGIRIVVQTFSGSGTVRAAGGSSALGAAGGGGRVFVDAVTDTFTGSLAATRGGGTATDGSVVRQ